MEIRGLGYQGDGFYSAKFDKNGVANVEFTRFADFNQTAIANESARIATAAAHKTTESGSLVKRDGTTCISQTNGQKNF